MNQIEYRLEVGKPNGGSIVWHDVSCDTLTNWQVRYGRGSETQQPSPAAGTWTLIYDDGVRGDVEPGDRIRFTGTLSAGAAQRNFTVANLVCTSVSRDFNYRESGVQRNRVTINANGPYAALARSAMPLPETHERLTGVLGYREPYYSGPVDGCPPHQIDGQRIREVVRAAGFQIEAGAVGEIWEEDKPGDGAWPGEGCDIIVGDSPVEVLPRNAPLNVKNPGPQRVTVDCRVLCGDSTLDVQAVIGGVEGPVQSLNSYLNEYVAVMNLPGGQPPMEMRAVGTPPPLTWSKATGIASNSGPPAETWDNIYGPKWRDGLPCTDGPLWSDAGTKTWDELSFTWAVHRGAFGVNGLILQPENAPGQWGSEEVAYRVDIKDDPNVSGGINTETGQPLQGLKRKDYVSQICTMFRSMVFENRDGHFTYYPRSVRSEKNPKTVAPIIRLDSCEVLAATVSTVDGSRVVNRVAVQYGGSKDEEGSATCGQSYADPNLYAVATDNSTFDEYGWVDTQITGNKVWKKEAAQAIADWTLNQYKAPRERVDRVTLLPLEKLDPDTALEVLRSETGEQISIGDDDPNTTDMPDGWISQGNQFRGWIEQTTIVGTKDSTIMTLTLSPYVGG